MSKKTCGDYGGKNGTCKRPAGWGIKGKSTGRCRDHINERTETEKMWQYPTDYPDNPELRKLWEMISEFCKKFQITSVPYFLLANNVIENYYIKKKAFIDMENDGITAEDRAHGKMKKKHPASTTYFKAHNALKSSLKELISKAKNEATDEDIKNDPLTKFYEKWS